MLDIRATHYVSPLSEVDFESVPLTVHITNVADETGLVTGKFRVYNNVTGLLIHTSDIAPLSLAAGASIDASALTDFDPPAIADDLYFVIFDGHASNALVPDGISFALGAFYFDVKAQGMGPAPATHAATHEEGGSDEIEVADMATAELDDTLVLQPDGAGGVEWEAVPAGVTDHDLLNNLAYADAGHTGFAPTAHDHQGDNLKFVKVHPNADATTALQILKADNATVVLNIDTTNRRLGLNTNAPVDCLQLASGNLVIPDTSSGATQGLRVRGASDYLLNYQGLDLSSITYAFFSTNRTYGVGGWSSAGWFGARAAASLQLENENLVLYQFAGGSDAGSPVLLVNTTGVGIGNITPSTKLDIDGDKLRLQHAKTPASAGAAGNAGDICWDADYIYVCVATNTWVRVETQSW